MKRTELKRTESLERRSPVRAVSAKRRKRDSGYPSSRREVYERAEGMCEARCAPSCQGQGGQVHHIAGRHGDDPHALENLLLCCQACHSMIHAHPRWAYDTGLMVRRNGGAS